MHIGSNIEVLLKFYSVKEGTLKEIGLKTDTYDNRRIYKIKDFLIAEEILIKKETFNWNNGKKEDIYKIDHDNLNQLIFGDWIIGNSLYNKILDGKVGVFPFRIKPNKIRY